VAHEEGEETEPANVDAYIGAQMHDHRSALGLSQAALGEKLGVSFQQV
jgi:hypothetical protein